MAFIVQQIPLVPVWRYAAKAPARGGGRALPGRL